MRVLMASVGIFSFPCLAALGCGDDRFPANCHMDCFGHILLASCEEGKAFTQSVVHAPIPCNSGYCPTRDDYSTCQKGCRRDLDGLSLNQMNIDFNCVMSSLCAHFLCEEYRPKKAGDACESVGDCSPMDKGEAAEHPDQDLTCDFESGICVWTP